MRSVFYPRLVNGPFGDPALFVRLAHRGEALLFDCGDLHPLSPRAALKIAAVFISHAHIDHLVGFDALLRLFLYREQPLLVFGPPGTVDRIAGRLCGYTWNLIEGYPFVLTVREWGHPDGQEATFRAQNAFRPEKRRRWSCPGNVLMATPYYRVRTLPLDHGGIPSLAFVLEEPLHVAIHKDALDWHGFLPGPWLTSFKDLVRRGAAVETEVTVPLAGGGRKTIPLGYLQDRIAHTERGMKISYVTDAAPTAANLTRIVELAADSHLLAIEAAFAHRDLARARERSHLTARQAGGVARAAGAAKLLVFHHSPRYQDQPTALAEEAQLAFTGKSASQEGDQEVRQEEAERFRRGDAGG